jgi:hypothetical protein
LVRRRLVGCAVPGCLGSAQPAPGDAAVLAYRLLYTIFGVRTYVPYIVLLLVLNLLIAHLLADPAALRCRRLLATAAVAVFAVVGAGWRT